MKKKRVVEITEFFCDVCGKNCGASFTTFVDKYDDETHACKTINEEHGKSCSDVLSDRLHANTHAKRDAEPNESVEGS